MNPHEEQFARSFIVRKKRDRYLTLLESKKGRPALLNGFNHCHDLDPRYATLIPMMVYIEPGENVIVARHKYLSVN